MVTGQIKDDLVKINLMPHELGGLRTTSLKSIPVMTAGMMELG